MKVTTVLVCKIEANDIGRIKKLMVMDKDTLHVDFLLFVFRTPP